MSRFGTWLSVLLATMAMGVSGCGGAHQAPVQSSGGYSSPADGRSPASAPQQAADGSDAKAAPAAAEAYGAPGVPGTATSGLGGAANRSRSDEALQPSAGDRPGLGTAWGETMQSHTTTSAFIRDSQQPFAVATLWYNDRQGAEAMVRAADYRSYERGVSDVMGGALTVSLRTERGAVLPGFFAGGKQYVIGEAGERYVVVIRNNTNFRYECVAGVDGLDVIDGLTAAYTKRGYLLQPYSVLEIDGFRRSADEVAAFRFSSVRGSYSARSGQGDANVGVIGVAIFNEQGTRPTWSPDELQRRHNADPFPGRYAVPPTN